MPATVRLPSSPKTLRDDSLPSSPSIPASPSLRRSLATCLLYGSTSVSITFFNKAVFSIYLFSFPGFVTLLQISVCLLLLNLAHLAGLIALPPLTRQTARLVLPLAVCWWTYVVSGIAALRFLNIPMFATLRKCTALLVLILEAVLLRKPARMSVCVAVLVMVMGGFIAGINDLSFNLAGYVLVAVCCMSTALYLIMIVSAGNRSKLDTFGLLYYNNVLSFPLMAGYILLFSDEVAQVAAYPRIGEIKFWAFLLFSAAQATLLNIAIFLCTKLNSPLATTVTGQMKDFITVGFGLFIFDDVKLNTFNLVGLAISMSGSVLYSLIKLSHHNAEKGMKPAMSEPRSPVKTQKATA